MTHRLCESTSVPGTNVGYVYGFNDNRDNQDCMLTFDIGPTDNIEFSFIYYSLRADVVVCDGTMFITLEKKQYVSGEDCKSVDVKKTSPSFRGPGFRLHVHKPALKSGFGFLLVYSGAFPMKSVFIFKIVISNVFVYVISL